MRNLLIASLLCCVSMSQIGAQEVKLELKEDKKPHVYIDGKKYDHAIFDLLDQSKIESVEILKDEKALEMYDAPNGVILIKTKSTPKKWTTVENQGRATLSSSKDPMVVIDGKVADQATLRLLSPNDIESINVLKGQTAIDLYEAPNGVLLVTTKE